jgi:hypothetical protein
MARNVVKVGMVLAVAVIVWAGTARAVPVAGNAAGTAQLIRSGSVTAELMPDGTVRFPRATGTADRSPAPGAPTDYEALQNPGFESGALTPWYESGGMWSIVTDNPHGGTYCAYDTGNNWIRQDFTGIPVSRITSIALWYRQPNAGIAAVDLFYTDASDTEDIIFPTATWQQFDVTSWLAPGKTLNGIRIWGYTGGPNPECYIDDISIQVVGDTAWHYGPFSNFGLTRFDGEYFPGTNKVYFMGGRKADASTDGTIYSYDVATQTYASTSRTLPTPVSNYEIALLLDNYDLPAGDTYGLYIFGGRVAAGTYTSAVQAYYPRSNRVVTVTADPYPNQTGGIYYIPACGPVYGNKAYVMGGFQNTAQPYVSNAVWVFDPLAPAGSRWTRSNYNLPYARGYIQAAVVDSFLYACGGDSFDGTNLVAKAQVARQNLLTPGAWATMANMPMIGGEAKAFGFNSNSPYFRTAPGDLSQKVIIAGHGVWPDEDNVCYIYDAPTNVWSNFPRLLRGRRNHAGAFIPVGSGMNGLPGIWIWGGRHTSDAIVGDTTEYFGFQVGPTGIAAEPASPLHCGLQVAPNPVRDLAIVTYTLARTGDAQLKVYDVTGKLRATLVDGPRPTGTSSVRLSTSGLPGGIYVLRLVTEGVTLTRKLVVK